MALSRPNFYRFLVNFGGGSAIERIAAVGDACMIGFLTIQSLL
jgi:hypothetical protein